MLEKTYGTQALRWETKEEEEALASLREDPLSRDEEMTHHFQLSLRDFYFYKNFLVDDLKWTSWAMASVACGILGFPFMSIVQPSEEELWRTEQTRLIFFFIMNHLPIKSFERGNKNMFWFFVIIMFVVFLGVDVSFSI